MEEDIIVHELEPTCTGDDLLAAAPEPSFPANPFPHVNRPPSVRIANEFDPLAAINVHELEPI